MLANSVVARRRAENPGLHSGMMKQRAIHSHGLPQHILSFLGACWVYQVYHIAVFLGDPTVILRATNIVPFFRMLSVEQSFSL